MKFPALKFPALKFQALALVCLACLACSGFASRETCRPGARRCNGSRLLSCADDRWQMYVDCAASGGVCNTGEGEDPEFDPETACGLPALAHGDTPQKAQQ